MATSDITIVLASRSPRRRQLVSELGFAMRCVDIDVDEVVPADTAPHQIPLLLAKLKSAAYDKPLARGELLVTADTVVVHDGVVLGKPHTPEDAATMLRLLSGDRHSVFTGVCIRSAFREESFVERTDVVFRSLDETTIRHYVDSGSCMDKAGAYGIQEWIGMVGVERIEGCYYNVVGLPVSHLYDLVVSNRWW